MKLISKVLATALAAALVVPSAIAATGTGTLAAKSHVAATKKMGMKKGTATKKMGMKKATGMKKGMGAKKGMGTKGTMKKM